MIIFNKNRLFILAITSFAFFISLIPLRSIAAKKQTINFNNMTIEAPYPLTHGVIAANLLGDAGKELLTISVDKDKNRWLIIYAFDVESKQYQLKEKTIIPKKLHSFDIGDAKKTLAQGKLQQIYFLSATKLYAYQVGDFIQLADSHSIYLKNEADYLQRGDFIRDLNNDVFDDVIVTNFNETTLLIGGEKNQFFKQSLPIKPRVRINDTGVSYTPITLYFSDTNFDGKVDVTFVGDGEAFVYYQLENGRFSSTAISIEINEKISGYEWWTKQDDSGEQLDQSNLEYRKLEEFRDLNADGVTDMVVRYSKVSGVLDRVNDYEIYLGEKAQKELVFPDTANSVIRADGTLTGIEFVDIDNDKKVEVLLAGFDIGLTQIIGALVAGSIDQDVYVFKMDQAGNFASKPNISKEVELNFSLSSGQSGSAVVRLADVNGDGLKDLILSNDGDELRIYLGQTGKKSFAKKNLKYKTQLPSDGNLVTVDDLNNDGKDDFLIKFSAVDGEDNNKKFKVLLAL